MKKIKKIQDEEKEKNQIQNLIQPISKLIQALLLKPVIAIDPLQSDWLKYGEVVNIQNYTVTILRIPVVFTYFGQSS